MRNKRQIADLTAKLPSVLPMAPKPEPTEWRRFERELGDVLRQNVEHETLRDFGWDEHAGEFRFHIEATIEIDDFVMVARKNFALSVALGHSLETTIELAIDEIAKWRKSVIAVRRALKVAELLGNA